MGRVLRIFFTGAFVLLCGAVLWLHYQLKPLQIVVRTVLPVSVERNGALEIHYPGRAILKEVARYDDELFAYYMFQHFSSATELREARTLLTHESRAEKGRYRVMARLPEDLPAAAALMTRFCAARLVDSMEWAMVPRAEAERFERQTRVFQAAYSLPVKQTLDRIPRSQLALYLRRFIVYRSRTDPRIRRRIEPAPSPVAPEDAARLAEDIITVAEFYSLPLDSLLGIAAMENNYMNVAGDLEHSVWKRRAAKDDIVLERRRGRVRVLNRAEGVWQITRETLRHVHKLYRRDERDYTLLPYHLRPPEELDMKRIDPLVLTTYAGLFFRELLDRFEGDTALAVGAYNGGPGRPNPRYEAGVRVAAGHARRMLEQAATMNGELVVGKQWLMP
jgi:hypothetical protein